MDEASLTTRIRSLVQDDLACLYLDGKVVLDGAVSTFSVEDMNRLFTVNVKEEFDRIVGLLPSTIRMKYRISELYPIIRKIMIILQGYTTHIYRRQPTEVDSRIYIGKHLMCVSLDALYGELGLTFSHGEYDVLNFSTTVNVLNSLNTFIKDSLSKAEESSLFDNIISCVLYSQLQFIASSLLIYLTVEDLAKVTEPVDSATTSGNVRELKDGISNSSLQDIPSVHDTSSSNDLPMENMGNETSEINTKVVDLENGNPISRVRFDLTPWVDRESVPSFLVLCNVIMDGFHRLDIEGLEDIWYRDMLVPVLEILNYGIYINGTSLLKKRDFMDVIISCIIKMSRSIVADEVIARFLIEIIMIANENIVCMNNNIKNVLVIRYNFIQNAANCMFTRDITSRNDVITSKPGDERANSYKDAKTHVHMNELKSYLDDFVHDIEHIHKYCFDYLTNVNVSNIANIEFIQILSQLILQITTAIQLSDSLVYITKTSPNIDVVTLLRSVADKLYLFLVLFVKNIPFRLLNAVFYYIGSNFNSNNLCGQILLFNALVDDHGIFNTEHYQQLVKMINDVFKASYHVSYHFISFEPTNSFTLMKLKLKYLKLPFKLLCKCFLMELASEEIKNGFLDLFADWCTGSYIYEYYTARCLCKFVVNLIDKDLKYASILRYLLDILLGVCFVDIRNYTLSLDSDLTIHPRLKNAFRCLRMIISTDFLCEWLLDNVVLVYTCSIIDGLGSLLKNVYHSNDPECDCILCTFTCYYSENYYINKDCSCSSSPIINNSPFVPHYLQLITILPWNKYDPDASDGTCKAFTFILNSLTKLFIYITEKLCKHKNIPKIEFRFTLLNIAIDLIYTLILTKHFDMNDYNIHMILQLYTLLGCSMTCIVEDELYLRLISQGLYILDEILRKIHNLHLAELHQEISNLLVRKLPKYPNYISKFERARYFNSIGLDIKAESALRHVLEVLHQVEHVDSYMLRVMYNYHMWKYCRTNNINDVQLNTLFIDKNIALKKETFKFKVFTNLIFVFSCTINDVNSNKTCSDILSLSN